jgi:ketosteroid isomerase-like protein
MGQARDVMDRLTTLAVEEHDLPSAVNCYAEDAVVMTPDAGEVRGRDHISEYWSQFVDAFPDSHYEHTGRYESGGTAIDEGYYTGTHLAVMNTPTGDTVPPTGRSLRLRTCDVVTVADGLIVEHHVYFDQADLLDQLGLGR